MILYEKIKKKIEEIFTEETLHFNEHYFTMFYDLDLHSKERIFIIKYNKKNQQLIHWCFSLSMREETLEKMYSHIMITENLDRLKEKLEDNYCII